MSDLKRKLVGAWRLTDWCLTDGEKEDRFLPPLGLVDACGGYLIYSENGVMSAMLARKERSMFKDSSLDGGTQEERADAFASIVAYSGTYELNDERSEVIHVVEHATLPHFIGQRMLRICVFDGDRLRLDTPSMVIGGVSRTSYIEWVRVQGNVQQVKGAAA
ncbi:lipocalin-like domain-containing protein [Burkholderia gladioli]|uniref:lipocalin-like domain-containing protein n=1 Tax=Burkholderia gladioli TaxID=28095 RepID=UPI000D00868B|nr:lipocalin-like domain-containing protein [Burkholderia gladioli]PRG51608.1 hypothetical protein C6V06_18180 [Burkholderia gladioli]